MVFGFSKNLYQHCHEHLLLAAVGVRRLFGQRGPHNDEVVTVSPDRLTMDHQWARIEEYVFSDIDRRHAVLAMQDQAGRHLDAAHYALDRIAVELVDVMPSIAAFKESSLNQILPLHTITRNDGARASGHDQIAA